MVFLCFKETGESGFFDSGDSLEDAASTDEVGGEIILVEGKRWTNTYMNYLLVWSMGIARIFFGGGEHFENFQKILKILHKKIAKNA